MSTINKIRNVRAEDDLSFSSSNDNNFMATDLYFKDLTWYMMIEQNTQKAIKLAMQLASSVSVLAVLALTIF
jgi:hypothetical protein